MLQLAEVDVAVAAWRYLSGKDSIKFTLGVFDGSGISWLFVRRLQVIVEGSESSAAVLSVVGSWASPNPHNTAQFPRLLVEIYSDCSRSSTKEIVADDAETKALLAWREFNNVLHRTYAFAEQWGNTLSDEGVRVWGSQLLGHPDVVPVPDWDGGVVLSAYYGLSIG